jgi:hypothetical protein
VGTTLRPVQIAVNSLSSSTGAGSSNAQPRRPALEEGRSLCGLIAYILERVSD